MPMAPHEHWKSSPDDHDYPAAHDYLSLSLSEDQATDLVEALKNAPLMHRKAKDLLRASGLTAATETNVHVGKDLEKVANGELLSPSCSYAVTLSLRRPAPDRRRLPPDMRQLLPE